MSYQAGTRVRVTTRDPDHHTRVPRYVRGHTGVIGPPTVASSSPALAVRK